MREGLFQLGRGGGGRLDEALSYGNFVMRRLFYGDYGVDCTGKRRKGNGRLAPGLAVVDRHFPDPPRAVAAP
jgi:hypothetical protein